MGSLRNHRRPGHNIYRLPPSGRNESFGFMVLRAMLAWSYAVTALAAVDQTWRSAPLDVVTLTYTDGTNRVTVDWGDQGESIERDPVEVREQYQRLLAFIKSPETLAYLQEIKAKADAEETRRGKEHAADWKRSYESDEQSIDLPTVLKASTREEPAPTWVRGMPWDVRQSLLIAMIDARSSTQVAWAENLRRTEPQATIFALGWTTAKDLTRIQRANVTLQLIGINSLGSAKRADAFAADYLVSGLPALIRFPSPDLLSISEGFGQ